MNSERHGFTLIEVMLTSLVGLIVLASILSVFVWALTSSHECGENAWAQTQATHSAQKMVSYMRNASGINAIDVSGTWVELSMPPTGTVSRFEYVNPTPEQGDGRILFTEDVSDASVRTQVVAMAVTEVMSLPSRNIFQQTSPRLLRIAYRVARPTRYRVCSAEIEVSVRLRNGS